MVTIQRIADTLNCNAASVAKGIESTDAACKHYVYCP